MRKKPLFIMIALLLCSMLLPMAAASAATYFTHEDQQAYACACLTEVYGYTAEEAEQFQYAFEQADGIATVRFWHTEHPEWVYHCTFSLSDGKRLKSETPFASDSHLYPGENGVRSFITQVHKEQLLTNWNKAAREKFAALLEQEDIEPCHSLEKGLLTAIYTAPEALHDFFASCYGEDAQWPEAVTQWYEWLLTENNLTTPLDTAPEAGITRYRMQDSSPYVLTEFSGTTPPELVDVLRHPKLVGWTLMGGVTVDYEDRDGLPTPDGNGLIALENGEKRILCLLYKPAEDNPDNRWKILPTCDEALPDGCEPTIAISDIYGNAGICYSVSFDAEGYGKAEFLLKRSSVANGLYPTLQLDKCTLTQPDGTVLEANHHGFEEVHLTVSSYSTSTPPNQQRIHALLPFDISYLNTETLLFAMTNPDAALGFEPPADAAFVSSVHLRKDTSSHSKDLGTFHSGVIAQHLGTESGDPHLWYHVRIGSLEGYMSGAYVDEKPGRSFHYPLPVAMVHEPVKLRENTVLFSKTIMEIQPGTTLHVLSNMGRWSYVCIPKQQPAGMWMDVDGVYGYVKTNQLTVGASALQLEWQFAEQQ